MLHTSIWATLAVMECDLRISPSNKRVTPGCALECGTLSDFGVDEASPSSSESEYPQTTAGMMRCDSTPRRRRQTQDDDEERRQSCQALLMHDNIGCNACSHRIAADFRVLTCGIFHLTKMPFCLYMCTLYTSIHEHNICDPTIVDDRPPTTVE